MRSTPSAVGLMLVVVLVAGCQGGSDEPEAKTFPLSWAVDEVLREQVSSETLSVGESRTYFQDLQDLNLTSFTVTVTWTDPIGAPDNFRVMVRDPDSISQTAKDGSTGAVTVVVSVNELPDVTEVTAANRTDAGRQARDDHSGFLGVGIWNVEVTLASAPGVIGPGGVETMADGSQDFSVLTTAEAYHVVVGTPRPAAT